ncbi:hypothetical protein OF83DRAFT_1170091 [Amylostereum chailletii]|nr:hypothetical protein OF83DRAFT_1170091 [Amylostereum chailletii]
MRSDAVKASVPAFSSAISYAVLPSVVAAALIVYEHLLQFSNEVEYFWKRRLTFGKLLFLWSRYYTIAFIVGNALVFLKSHPTYEAVAVAPFSCSRFFHWQNTGASIQVITTHLVLVLRLYAMYRNSRVIVALLIFVVIGESVVLGVLFGVPSGFGTIISLFPNVHGYDYNVYAGGNSPANGVFICADYDDPGKPWVVFYYTAILVTESIFFSLSIYSAWTHRKTALKNGIFRVLTKDSVYYFGFLFWIYLGNQVIWIYNIPALNELGTGFGFSLSAIFANRLMISLRRAYYKRVDDDERGYTSILVPISCAQSPVAANASENDEEYELRTFNERTGF